MDLVMNFGFAWIAVILTFVLSIIFIFRLLSRKSNKGGSLAGKVYKYLKKQHKALGILVIATGLIHGLFSSDKVWSLNLGTVCWIISILLALNWLFRKFLSRFKGWMYYHRVLSVLFLLSIVIHIVDVGGIQVQKYLFTRPDSQAEQVAQGEDSYYSATADTDSKKLTGGTYKDGTFTGEAQGYRPGLTVDVEIKDNAIVKVDVTGHNEVNSRFYSLPIEVVPQEIIDNQTTEVDTVSGATFTSIGIINAVNNALSKALISGEVPKMQDLPQFMGHGRR